MALRVVRPRTYPWCRCASVFHFVTRGDRRRAPARNLLSRCLERWPIRRPAARGVSNLSARPQTWTDPSRSDEAAARLDIIFIEGLLGHTVIGIHESELHEPQPLRIDLQAGLPRSAACDTDRIGDT